MENVKRKIWILSFSLGLVVIVTGDQKTCNQKLRCNECITAHPDCAWCNTEDFTGTRCSTVDDLNNKGCGDMSHPSNQVEFLQDDSLRNGSTSHDSLQLAPQHIRLKMKPGEKYHLHMKYLVAANIPIDMYFIMDFTTTMDRRIQQLADLTQELIDGLKQTFTTNIQIGFGSFLDKVVQPFTLTTAKRATLTYITGKDNHLADHLSRFNVSLENPCGYPPCGSPYAFIHRWKLTDDVDGFISMIRNSNTSANWDPMEGGLDAVLQASVCPEVIGWRNQSRRVLIHISDGGFHFAGDGKLGGIDRPSDGQCHLEPLNDNSGQYSYTQASNQDYPSFGHIKHVLKENGINAFFLSVSSNIKIYKGLTDFIGSQADTAEMDNTGAYKLIRSISEFYTALSSKLNIAAVDIPEDVSVIAETNCSTSRVESTFDLKKKPIECKGLQIGTLVHINVTFLVNECPVNKDEKRILKILPSGLQESLTVEIEYICDCDCPTSEALDEQCSYGNGTYECGVCRCHEGRSGELCQCNFGDESDVTVNEQKCKMDEKSSTLCENRGTCNCGQCFCHKNYDGKYCECDSSKCVYPGTSQKCTSKEQGDCSCGKCICKDGFYGDYCECPPKSQCLAENELECSGHGECDCGQCKCKTGYNGTLCEDCPRCSNCVRCGNIAQKKCIQCLNQHKGESAAFNTSCKLECDGLNVIVVEGFTKESSPCNTFVSESCKLSYLINCTNSTVDLMYSMKLQCVNPPDPLLISMPILAGIIGVGLLLLIIWKILTTFYDKIEYAKFEHEIQHPKWSKTDNPIYKTPVTSNQNPAFRGNLE